MQLFGNAQDVGRKLKLIRHSMRGLVLAVDIIANAVSHMTRNLLTESDMRDSRITNMSKDIGTVINPQLNVNKEKTMHEKYNVLDKNATIYDLVKVAARELIENGLDAFEFDIPGVGPEGAILLHFEASIRKVGNDN